VKIQDSSFQWLSLNTIDSMKKSPVSSSGQSENLTDTYISSGDLTRIEKGVFQLLKNIIKELKDTIGGLPLNNQSRVLSDLRVQLPETILKSSAPGDTMIMLVLTGKGTEGEDEVRVETQVKLILSYNADVPNAEIFRSSEFLGRVAHEAREFAVLFAGKETVEGDNTQKGDASVEPSQGFAFLFSYAGKSLDREAATTLMSAFTPAESDGRITQIPVQIPAGTSTEKSDVIAVSFVEHSMPDKAANGRDTAAISLAFIAHAEESEGQNSRTHSGISLTTSGPAIIYGTLGKTLNAQDIDALAPNGMGEGDIFKKLFALISGTHSENAQYTPLSLTMTEEQSVFPMHEKTNLVVMSFSIQQGKNNTVPFVTTPMEDGKQPIDVDEGMNEGGTTLYAGYGQGELKSSPMAGPPLFSSENEKIVSKTEAFVNHLNMLLGENANTSGASDDVTIDAELFSEISPDNVRLLQTRSPEMRAVVQNITKKIFSKFEEFLGIELTGLSPKENGMLSLNTSTLVSQLTSNREETIDAVKGFGNTLFDRINYLMNPYAGIYVDDKNILSMRAAQKDEGASFQEKEMQKEQNSLEKRLNELKILIEDSQLLTEWFKKNGVISLNDEYKTEGN